MTNRSGDQVVPIPKTPKATTPGRARPDEPLAEWCEVAVAGVCQGRATNRHHKLRRGNGGGDEPENTVDVCGTGTTGCHGFIHSNPEWAYRLGWLTRRSA